MPKRLLLLLVLTALFLPMAAKAQTAYSNSDIAAMCDRADSFFESRHLDTTDLDSAYNIAARAHAARPVNERAVAMWCKVNIEQGDRAKTTGEKLPYYRAAQAAAETLRNTDDASPEGHFWWASAFGKIGLAEGFAAALTRVGTCKTEFERTLELDSNYVFADAILGIPYRELPAALGGDHARSRVYFENGIARSRNFTLLRLELAKLELKDHDSAAAKAQLEAIRSTKRPLYPAAYALNDRPQATRLLGQLSTE